MNGDNLDATAFISITPKSCFIYKMFSKLRVWLLPMLMNGQVTVKDMEEENLAIVAESEVRYGKKSKIKFCYSTGTNDWPICFLNY